MSNIIYDVFNDSGTYKPVNSKCNEKFCLARKRYMRNRLLCTFILQNLKANQLPEELKDKVQTIINRQDTLELISLTKASTCLPDSALLGITNIGSQSLTYEDESVLKPLTERHIFENYLAVIGSLSGVKCFINNSFNDKLLLDFKLQLRAKQDLYATNLQNYWAQLEELVKLKLEVLPKVSEAKVEEYEIKTKLHSLKCNLLHNKIKVMMFMESSKSLKAYQELLSDISTLRANCHTEIEDLMAMKERYKHINSKQFEEILKTYLDYHSAISKKRLTLEKICKRT